MEVQDSKALLAKQCWHFSGFVGVEGGRPTCLSIEEEEYREKWRLIARFPLFKIYSNPPELLLKCKFWSRGPWVRAEILQAQQAFWRC